jgi:alkanesulfonate monooxygenase SsuD/methylene tetrahydromethanopterin reductase-like flavin-dependent oxidoreductase (luciferase family)
VAGSHSGSAWDHAGCELSITGEEIDDRQRAGMLDDESLQILTAAWSGEPVHHRGEYYTVDSKLGRTEPDRQPDDAQGHSPGPVRCRDQNAAAVATTDRMKPASSGTPNGSDHAPSPYVSW